MGERGKRALRDTYRKLENFTFKGVPMTKPPISSQYLTTTETYLRFYVLLTQYLDRCLDDGIRESLSEKDFQGHLSETRTTVLDLLATNRIVKEKVEKEYEYILNLGKDYLENSTGEDMRKKVEEERETLRIKMLALSDLLAVFRSA
jgi:hypothetical protein